jgi:hypothetical protein
VSAFVDAGWLHCSSDQSRFPLRTKVIACLVWWDKKKEDIMQFLDSTLAFVLTLAALATVVTVIMEACLRITRMRKKNFVDVMKLLNKELGRSRLGMDEEERWKFFVRAVQNPAEAAIEKLNPELAGLKLEDRLAYLGSEKSAGKGKFERLIAFIRQIFGDRKRSGLYTTVSLEYMLRCLAESQPVRQASLTASQTVKTEFNRIARKYEELGSSVSASFKHHAQAWSVAIGIALSIGANIDGLRIFEAFRADPRLAASVIDKQDTFINTWEESKASQFELDGAITAFEDAKMAFQEAEGAEKKDQADIDQKKKLFEAAKADMDRKVALTNVQMTAERAQQQMADLAALGVPIGWQLYPDCPFGDTVEAWAKSSPKCKAIPMDKREIGTSSRWIGSRIWKTLLSDPGGFFLWLMVAVGTGVLIGLGAPFWFDVAKRLAQIRKGVQNTNASAEYRLAGSDANGKYERRLEIVNNVLSEAANETAIGMSEQVG